MSDPVFSITQDIEIVNLEPFAKSYEDYLNGKAHFAELHGRDVRFKAFDTQPLKGFEAPEKFPYCCQWHERIYEQAKEKLNDFPACCIGHKKLIGQSWFDKLEYAYLPDKTVYTIAYTLHCIDESAPHDSWYKKITDYIDYTQRSYGQFPWGFGVPLGLSQYLSCIESNIQDRESLNEHQKAELTKFLEKKLDPDKEKRAPDLNQVIDTYKQWLRVFPFNISYLSHLKPHFQNMLPIFCEPMETNLYTGVVSWVTGNKRRLKSPMHAIKSTWKTFRSMIKRMNALI